MNQTNPTVCPSCAAEISDNYCSICGEKKRTSSDLSFKHFVEESVEGISHFDNKFFRSFRLLFTKPGDLTVHFEQGRRVPFMKPFQLFIVSNLLFFLVASGPNLFATPFNTFNSDNYARYGTTEIINKKAKTGIDKLRLATAFNQKMVTESKVFIILFIPVLALACYILFIRKKKYLSLHLTFAAHFFSFILLYFIVFFLLVELPVRFFYHSDNNPVYDNIFGFVSIAIFITYLSLATRRFYKAHLAWCITASLGIVGVFLSALTIYRLLLFYKIINSIS
jgi:hypothetical protein